MRKKGFTIINDIPKMQKMHNLSKAFRWADHLRQDSVFSLKSFPAWELDSSLVLKRGQDAAF